MENEIKEVKEVKRSAPKKNKKECHLLFIKNNNEVYFEWDSNHTLRFKLKDKELSPVDNFITVTYNGEFGKADFKVLDIK